MADRNLLLSSKYYIFIWIVVDRVMRIQFSAMSHFVGRIND